MRVDNPSTNAVALYRTSTAAQSRAPHDGQIVAVLDHGDDPTSMIKGALRRGYTFITVTELWEAIQGLRALPQKPILFTSDDSRHEVFTVIHPKMVQYGVKGTCFVVSDFVDGNPDGQVEAGLAANTPATWANLAAMYQTGLWDFQNHSRTHNVITSLDSATLRSDLTICNQKIVQNIGCPTPIAISYPTGTYDAFSIPDLIATGMKLGFDFDPGSASGIRFSRFGTARFTINRRQVSDSTCLQWARDDVFHVWDNDADGGINASNQLGFWTLSAGGTLDQAGVAIRVDNRSAHAAQSTITADYFLVKPTDVLYYYFQGWSELQTAGNGGIRIAQYDKAKAFIANVDLKAWTAASAAASFEGEIPLDPTCRFIRLEVWCDAAYDGIVHYMTGQLRLTD